MRGRPVYSDTWDCAGDANSKKQHQPPQPSAPIGVAVWEDVDSFPDPTGPNRSLPSVAADGTRHWTRKDGKKFEPTPKQLSVSKEGNKSAFEQQSPIEQQKIIDLLTERIRKLEAQVSDDSLSTPPLPPAPLGPYPGQFDVTEPPMSFPASTWPKKSTPPPPLPKPAPPPPAYPFDKPLNGAWEPYPAPPLPPPHPFKPQKVYSFTPLPGGPPPPLPYPPLGLPSTGPPQMPLQLPFPPPFSPLSKPKEPRAKTTDPMFCDIPPPVPSRSRSRSRRRSRWASPTRSITPVDDKPTKPTVARSHEDILPSHDDSDDRWDGNRNKSFHLHPFNKDVYVTYHASTSTTFSTFLPLLTHAQEGEWYTLPTPTQLRTLQDWKSVLAALPTAAQKERALLKAAMPKIEPIAAPRPAAVGVPIINASRALTLRETPDDWRDCACAQRMSNCNRNVKRTCAAAMVGDRCYDPRCPCKISLGDQGWPCEECRDDSRLPLSDDRSVVWVSVVQAVMGGEWKGNGYPAPSVGLPEPFVDEFGFVGRSGKGSGGKVRAGTPIYRVVRAGSRAEAAARAFYEAGSQGWSTVFVCAVRGAFVSSKTIGQKEELDVEEMGLWERMQKEFGHLGFEKHAETWDELVVEEIFEKNWWPVLY